MSADVHSLSGAYVLNAVTDEERALFEAHLDECAACRQEVAELSGVLPGLASATAEVPPATLRDSVMAAVEAVRPLPPLTAPTPSSTDQQLERRRGPIGRPGVLAIAAVVLVLAGMISLLTIRPWNNMGSPSPVEQVLDAQDAQRIEGRFDGLQATLVFSRSKDRAVLSATEMPPPPAGHDYQLWYQRPGKGMQPAGLMPKDAESVALSGPLGDATAVGLTVEPAGGSPQPTTKPIALFELH